jgi:purine-binding chemotaxis protein CheW
MSVNKAEIAPNQYLTFQLGAEMFALDVAQVREILDFTTITKVPRAPAFMRGVINVRGSVVPVVDLALKFDMAQTEKTLETRIVVVEVECEGEVTVIGAVADAVRNVIEIDPAQIEATPRIGAAGNADFIKGIGKQQDAFIIILDVDRIFSAGELAEVHPTVDQARQAA